MYDFWEMEHRVLQALQPHDERDVEFLRFCAEREARTVPLRRRLANAIVGLGLKLDPEALAARPRQIALEAVNVRD